MIKGWKALAIYHLFQHEKRERMQIADSHNINRIVYMAFYRIKFLSQHKELAIKRKQEMNDQAVY